MRSTADLIGFFNLNNTKVMGDYKISELPEAEPRKSDYEFDDLYRRLSSVNRPGSEVANPFCELILCLMNEIAVLKEQIHC